MCIFSDEMLGCGWYVCFTQLIFVLCVYVCVCVCVCVLVIQCLKTTNLYLFLIDQVKLELMHCKKFTNFFCYFYSSGSTTVLEKAVATHCSTLAWKIPWTEEPGGLQSMGSLRVVHYWATSLSLFTFMHWRRKWQPTPVFLPGESQGQRSLVGCCLWGHTELDMTEAS